jgi:hypothetical protein
MYITQRLGDTETLLLLRYQSGSAVAKTTYHLLQQTVTWIAANARCLRHSIEWRHVKTAEVMCRPTIGLQ